MWTRFLLNHSMSWITLRLFCISAFRTVCWVFYTNTDDIVAPDNHAFIGLKPCPNSTSNSNWSFTLKRDGQIPAVFAGYCNIYIACNTINLSLVMRPCTSVSGQRTVHFIIFHVFAHWHASREDTGWNIPKASVARGNTGRMSYDWCGLYISGRVSFSYANSALTGTSAIIHKGGPVLG